MPTVPPGVPDFEIKPPLTTGDKGLPGPCVYADAGRVFDFVEDERLLVAMKLLESVRARIKGWQDEKENREKERKVEAEQQQKAGLHLPRLAPALKRPAQFVHLHRHHQQHDQKEGEEKASSSASDSGDSDDEAHQRARDLLEENSDRIDALERRCELFRRVQRNLRSNDDGSNDDGEAQWTFGSRHFGVTTFYRRNEDGSLSLRLDGALDDVPLFEQVCVLKEIDLHSTWAPFCTSSLTVADLGKLDVVGWFLIGMPHFGLARDGCFRAIGCDNIAEDGTILLAAQGIRDKPQPSSKRRRSSRQGSSSEEAVAATPSPSSLETEERGRQQQKQQQSMSYKFDSPIFREPILDELDIPPAPKRRGSGRITIKEFCAAIEIKSPTSAVTRIVANVNPNLSFLPQSLLDFLMKHVAGVLLAKLQAAAKRAVRNPKSNPHSKRMRDESEFYERWLMAKFQALCDERGWKMPEVKALECDETDSDRVRASFKVGAPSWGPLRQRASTYAGAAVERVDGTDSLRLRAALRLAPPSSRGQPLQPASTDAGRAVGCVEESDSDHLRAALKVAPPSGGPLRQRASSYAGTTGPDDEAMASSIHSDDGVQLLQQNQIVENMSSISSPINIDTAGSVLSDMTSRSGLSSVLWGRSNPIVAYIKEMEMKTQRVKAEKEAEARRRAARRLRPEPLSTQHQTRLEELKQAKARFMATKASPTATTTATSPVQSLASARVGFGDAIRHLSTTPSQRFTARLHSHRPITKILVVSLLVAVLFAMLHPHQVLKLPLFPPEDGAQWVMLVCECSLTVLYILIVSVSHFCTCDVALVYAFGSLHIGKLSGVGVRQYYSDNVRQFVAMVSLGIAAVSVGKASAKAGSQALLWGVMKILARAQKLFGFERIRVMGDLSDSMSVKPSISVLSGVAGRLVSIAVNIVQEAWKLSLQFLIRSNTVGRRLEFVVGYVYFIVSVFLRASWNQWNKFVEDTAENFDGKAALASWRDEVFSTAKMLFSYTSIFLITLLVLFNLSARSSRSQSDPEASQQQHAKELSAEAAKNKHNQSSSRTQSLKIQFSNMSSLSSGSFVETTPGVPTIREARGLSYDAIPEEKALSPAGSTFPTINTGASRGDHDALNTRSGESNMRSLGLRLRRRKAPPVADCGEADDFRDLHKSFSC